MREMCREPEVPEAGVPNGGQEDGVPKACHQQAAADSQGVPNVRVCEHPLDSGWHTQGWKDELTSCRGTV